jgi:hypothetical protein
MKMLRMAGIAIAAAGALALMEAPASAAPPYHHYHGHYYHHGGGDVAAGVVGGLAAGALVGAAVAASTEPDCYYENRRIYIRGVGWRVRQVEVCD